MAPKAGSTPLVLWHNQRAMHPRATSGAAPQALTRLAEEALAGGRVRPPLALRAVARARGAALEAGAARLAA